MKRLINAFICAIAAERRLQDELCKRYPFGSNDPEKIRAYANDWRARHSVKAYAKRPDLDDDSWNYVMPSEPVATYTGAYGVFGSHLGNITCQHGCGYVKAHNPDEAKDLLFLGETYDKHDAFYDDWLLTDLIIYDDPVNQPNAKYRHI